MTKDEAKTLVAAGRIQSKILELCEQDPSLLPLGLAERIRENNDEIRNLLQAAIDSYRKKADIASKFLEEAEDPIDIAAEDVQLQLDLQDVAAVSNNTATWRQDMARESAVQMAILEKAQEGAGRTACLEAAMSATGKTKAEVEVDWNGLVRNGLIEQKGKRWKATEQGLEALAKPNAQVEDDLEIVEETPEQMKDALDVRNAKLAEDLAAIASEENTQASQPAEQVTIDPQWAITAPAANDLNF